MGASAGSPNDRIPPPAALVERWGIQDEGECRRAIQAASSEELEQFADELMKDVYNPFYDWFVTTRQPGPPFPPEYVKMFPVVLACDLACIELERRFAKPS
jgi:hypothetical protein